MADVNEAHFAEVEKTLLYISDARRRAEKALNELRRDNAEPHLIDALEEAERELGDLARHLMQQTYFAVPKDQLSFERATPVSV
jgi:septation ring formation regulator EzrA